MSSYLSKPLPGTPLNPLHPLAKGIVGYWLFNEGAGNLTNDISGLGNHGHLKGMVPNTQGSGWSGSKHGGGLSFDDVDDYVECGNDKSLDVTTGLTISALIYPKNVLNFCTIVGKMGADDLHSSIYMFIANNNAYLRIYDVTGSWVAVAAPVVVNKWQNIVGTYDGSNLKIYNYGTIKHTDSAPTINTNVNSVRIGGNERWTSELFEGIMDNVIYWTKSISSFEVKQLYQDPYCMIK